jgi:hypothetical protein
MAEPKRFDLALLKEQLLFKIVLVEVEVAVVVDRITWANLFSPGVVVGERSC